MRVSLKTFLRTAAFGDLRPGMSPEQIQALLGAPDAVGNTSRKYRRPSIFLYGTVEVWFTQQPPQEFLKVYWEAGERGVIRLPPTGELTDWDLLLGMKLQEVEAFLRSNDLTFDHDATSPTPALCLPSGVRITFDESGRLYSIYG